MSNYPGLGVMIHYLAGGSKENASDFYGRVIVAVEKTEDAMFLSFHDGEKIKIFDDGQSCCESRYMTCDDDISSLVGHKLERIEVKEGPTETDGEYGEEHETCFIEIGTDAGFVTLTNHNEHNGYYGGFGLSIERVN
jgi:hypothetical protein